MKLKSMKHLIPVGSIVGMGIAMSYAGCAESVPTERIVNAEAAIKAADEVGAAKVPGAADYLRLARQEADQAQARIDAGDDKAANGLLVRARADAELALAKAHEAPLVKEAKQARARVEAMRQTRGM
jgi:hypothetical protein